MIFPPANRTRCTTLPFWPRRNRQACRSTFVRVGSCMLMGCLIILPALIPFCWRCIICHLECNSCHERVAPCTSTCSTYGHNAGLRSKCCSHRSTLESATEALSLFPGWLVTGLLGASTWKALFSHVCTLSQMMDDLVNNVGGVLLSAHTFVCTCACARA